MLLARHGRLRRRSRKHRSILLVGVLLLASIVALLLATVAFTGQQLLLSQCNLSDLRPLALGQNSFLYTDNMQRLGVVPSATNRQKLPLSKISPSLPEATVAIEDARFWQHGALDYQGILRALYQNLSKGHIVQGGSTITQELVRNLYIGNPQRTLSRKVKEACLATKFFQTHTRKQILADYLNEVFYGRHAYGAQAAARTYFSKPASRLTLVQAALLAGLPQAPTVYDPLRNPHAALARRNEVLHAMWKNHYISKSELRSATRRKLQLRPGHLYSELHQPNFFGWATQQLGSSLGHRRVELGGLTVKTTLNMRLQGLALHAVSSVLHTPTDPAAAIVSIDPKTGAVKAMVDYLPSGQKMQFNLATQAHRSTGSSFKPITLATALSMGVSLNSTFYGPPELNIITPACATNNGPWDVHNFADEAAGTMSLRDATAYSVNTIFAQLIAKIGARERPGDGAQPRHHEQRELLQARVCHHARLGRVHAARDDRRVRDIRGRRRPPRPAGFRERSRAERKGDSAERQGEASPQPERRRPAHVRPAGRGPARHGHSSRARGSAGGRQDRDRRELPGRLVLRLRASAGDVRLGRLPEGRDLALQRRGRRSRSPAGRCPPRSGTPT